MPKKTLTVPQNGTQPAPIDNMLSGELPAPARSNVSNKRPTSFNIDRGIFARFKADCARRGLSMSAVIENFMAESVDNRE